MYGLWGSIDVFMLKIQWTKNNRPLEKQWKSEANSVSNLNLLVSVFPPVQRRAPLTSSCFIGSTFNILDLFLRHSLPGPSPFLPAVLVRICAFDDARCCIPWRTESSLCKLLLSDSSATLKWATVCHTVKDNDSNVGREIYNLFSNILSPLGNAATRCHGMTRGRLGRGGTSQAFL